MCANWISEIKKFFIANCEAINQEIILASLESLECNLKDARFDLERVQFDLVGIMLGCKSIQFELERVQFGLKSI